jgi:hypothetical protein
MKLSIIFTFLPRPCVDCRALTRGRVSGTRYEMQRDELYAEEVVGAPLCPACHARSRWAVPAAWLAAIARHEQAAKARLADWEAIAECGTSAAASR